MCQPPASNTWATLDAVGGEVAVGWKGVGLVQWSSRRPDVQIPILIEPVSGNGYRARGMAPFTLTADGATREEALARLRQLLADRLSGGAEIVALDLPAAAHPLAEFAGMFKDDPDFAEVLEIMAENRRKMDADPDVP